MKNDSFVVLLAEDNEHDIIAVKRAWKKNNLANPLYIVNDGEECLDYLFMKGKYNELGSAPRPELLILDINMPKINGIKILEHISADKKLKYLPVIILTTSKAPEDRLQCYNLGVNAYVVKPFGFQNLSDLINNIRNFWQWIELPEEYYG